MKYNEELREKAMKLLKAGGTIESVRKEIGASNSWVAKLSAGMKKKLSKRTYKKKTPHLIEVNIPESSRSGVGLICFVGTPQEISQVVRGLQ